MRACTGKARLVAVIAASTSALCGVPLAAADTVPPQGGGGCHMVTEPIPGLNQMMQGSAHGTGYGADGMSDMLALFACA